MRIGYLQTHSGGMSLLPKTQASSQTHTSPSLRPSLLTFSHLRGEVSEQMRVDPSPLGGSSGVVVVVQNDGEEDVGWIKRGGGREGDMGARSAYGMCNEGGLMQRNSLTYITLLHSLRPSLSMRTDEENDHKGVEEVAEQDHRAIARRP